MTIDLAEGFKHLIERRNELAHLAKQQYKPLVNQIIVSDSRDSQQIKLTLDGLLDFCFDDEILLLYRKLCRHLYSFDPVAACYYVNAYREEWDEEGAHFGKNNQDNKQ
ncbi:MAG TPA: hypothetical protein PLW37_09450 [bacterium]|nr:hypothetical protein [bacterium]